MVFPPLQGGAAWACRVRRLHNQRLSSQMNPKMRAAGSKQRKRGLSRVNKHTPPHLNHVTLLLMTKCPIMMKHHKQCNKQLM